MQAKLTISHTNLNSMFKQQVHRQEKLDSSFDKFNERLIIVENFNNVLNERTQSHSDLIADLRKGQD